MNASAACTFFNPLCTPLKILLLVASHLFIPVTGLEAQDTAITDAGSSDAMQMVIERLAEESQSAEEEIDIPFISDAQPHIAISLNSADENALRNILGLTDGQIENLVRYRKRYGPLLSIYELPLIDAFDSATVDRIKSLVSSANDIVTDHIPLRRLLKAARQEMLVRMSGTLERSKGYYASTGDPEGMTSGTRYPGNPFNLLVRYRFQAFDRIKAGVSAEKDAGEEFFKGSQKQGFDFYSAFLQLNHFGTLKRLIAGDYQVDFGQGLTISTGTRFSNWLEASQGVRAARGIYPHSGTSECRFMRGLAATASVGPLELTAFISCRHRDASGCLYDPVDSSLLSVSSLTETGLHRTTNEILKKGLVKECICGGHVSLKKSWFEIGTTAYRSLWDADLRKQDAPYDHFCFTGRSNTNAGLDARVIGRFLNLFGEVSMSVNGAVAAIAGVSCKPLADMSWTLIYRNYPPDYHNLLCQALGANSENANEKGIFMAITARVSGDVSLQAYADVYRFPWLKYAVTAPSYGHEYSGQINWQPSGHASMYLLFRQKYALADLRESSSAIDRPEPSLKDHIRFNMIYDLLHFVKLQSRMEWTLNKQTKGSRTCGYLFFQEATFKAMKKKVGVTFRYALFDTGSYDDRIYCYENDVLYASSAPAYFDRGTRILVLLRAGIVKNLDLWVRLTRTDFLNKPTVGSGLDEISGTAKTDIKLQFRWKL
jgi:hypothetical protein